VNRKKPTILLVHGAWADESSWNPVVNLLKEDSIEAVTVSLPLSSLADDVAALDATLDSVEGAAVVVGHAYAGAVIASTRSDKVAALVYVTALAPDEGETVAEVFDLHGHDDRTPELKPDGDGWIRLPRQTFATAFAPDATPEQQRRLAAVQRPIAPACITVPVGRPLWRSVPAWYLVAQHDRMIPERTQRYMAERMQAHSSVHPVDHLPSVTAPRLVADVIVEALRGSAA
jgi:pimeloyl-ACP methyl ester carboxylesterase